MISSVELHRILAEWRVRLQRAKEILQRRPGTRRTGASSPRPSRSWSVTTAAVGSSTRTFTGTCAGICRTAASSSARSSIFPARRPRSSSRRMAVSPESVGSYTWLWAEFDMDGQFARDPYWVEGTWKDALTAFLLPLDRQSAYLLAGRAETPDSPAPAGRRAPQRPHQRPSPARDDGSRVRARH